MGRKSNIVVWVSGIALGMAVAILFPYFPKDLPGISSLVKKSGSGVFRLCYVGGGTNCVVDGDTFWFQGERIRIADIDAPETHPPRCFHEAELGRRATDRLQDLLNAGPIELESVDRDTDVYGRKLRIVSRSGQSLGLALVSEGLARRWTGRREPWC